MEGNWFKNVEWRPHPWPGLTWLTTAIVCNDVSAAISFYSQALNFIPIAELRGDDGKLLFARMRFRGSNFTVNAPGFDSDIKAPSIKEPSSFIFYLYLDDVPATATRMINLGAQEIFAPRKEFWGDIRARLVDPFGYIWDIAQRGEEPSDSAS